MKYGLIILLFVSPYCMAQSGVLGHVVQQTVYNPFLYEMMGQSNAEGSEALSELQSGLSGAQVGRYIYSQSLPAWNSSENFA